VVAARNDQHRGGFLRRLQLFVTGLLEQAKVHGLESELVIVEWNPPDETPKLREARTWPRETGPCTVRIIEVSRELHQRFKNADKLALHQMIAKNVGIRRARGRYVLATTADLLFSNELVEFLASGKLKPGTMYRIDRYDVRSDVPENVSLKEQLDYCERNIIRINGRLEVIPTNAARLLTYKPRFRIRLPIDLYLLLGRGFRGREMRGANTSFTSLGLAMRYLRWHFSPPYPVLHMGAPGDFTLLAREDWASVGGYPELPIYPAQLDCVFCHIAYHNGMREEVLEDPMRIYHIEHEPGWLPMWQMKEKLDAAGIPMLSGSQYLSWVIRLCKQPGFVVVNSSDWGLGSEQLQEVTVQGH
jgi:hypothetical protein